MSTAIGVARHGARALGLGAVTAGLVGASWATLQRQAREASDAIEKAARQAALEQGLLTDGAEFHWQVRPPNGDGVYLPDGAGPRRTGPAGTRVLTMIGDSTSVGYGCQAPADLPGVVLSRAAAAALGRPMRLTSRGRVGAISADLAGQAVRALGDAPDAVAIMVGANDVRDLIPPQRAAEQLGEVVAGFRAQGISVVVGTCPDLGTITPIQQPLRQIAGVWSRTLARLQERAVTRAGGIAVPLDRLVSPDFYGRPELFYADGFHPSALGYARASAALSPAVIDSLR